MPFIGGLVVSGALVLAGLFGFQATSGGGHDASQSRAGWKERQALCQGPATAREEALCELLRESAAKS